MSNIIYVTEDVTGLGGMSLSQAIEYLQRLQEDLPQDASNAEIRLSTYSEWGEDYASAELRYSRPKTAEELRQESERRLSDAHSRLEDAKTQLLKADQNYSQLRKKHDEYR